MTAVAEAVASVLATVGLGRSADEVVRRLPVETTVEDVTAADITPGTTAVDVVAAIRAAVRTRLSGARDPQPQATRPPPVPPLPTPPDADVFVRGLGQVRGALAGARRPDDQPLLGLGLPEAAAPVHGRKMRHHDELTDLWSALQNAPHPDPRMHPPG